MKIWNSSFERKRERARRERMRVNGSDNLRKLGLWVSLCFPNLLFVFQIGWGSFLLLLQFVFVFMQKFSIFMQLNFSIISFTASEPCILLRKIESPHWLARASIIKYHRLSGFNHKEIYFLTVLEAKSPRSRCRQGWSENSVRDL